MPQGISTSELLQWGVQHTTSHALNETPTASETVNREAIDPKWLEVILGKEDAVRMKECVEIIETDDKSLDEKIAAFDDLEMLVESLDNANDLEPLKLWPPIIGLLESPQPELRMYAAWVIGTAIQNNPKSQNAFLKSNGLPKVLHVLATDSDASVRAKALYSISNAVRHTPLAFNVFIENNGFSVLASVARDGDARLLKRIMFFLRSLLEEEEDEDLRLKVASAIAECRIPEMAADVVVGEAEDADLVEKCLELLQALGTKYPDLLDAELRGRIRTELLPAIRDRFGKGEITGDLVKGLENTVATA